MHADSGEDGTQNLAHAIPPLTRTGSNTQEQKILRRGTGFAALLERIGSRHTRGPHQHRQCGIACHRLEFPEPALHLGGDGALHARAVVSMPPAKNGASSKADQGLPYSRMLVFDGCIGLKPIRSNVTFEQPQK